MADKLKFTSWAEWDIEMRDRAEREAERERTDPWLMRIREQIDALNEKARLAQVEVEEEAKRKWIEIEEEAKRKRYEDVRLAVAAILEEEAKPGADAKMRRVLIARARARLRKPTPAERAAGIERLVPLVDAACVPVGREPAHTDKCVAQVRPHLPAEERHAPGRWLKEALGVAKERRAAKKN
jgi:hypothetical protein